MNSDPNTSFIPVAQENVQQRLECWDTLDINQTSFPTYWAINIFTPNTPPFPPISLRLHQAPTAPCILFLTKDVPPGFLSQLMKTYRGRREGAGWGRQVTSRWKPQTPDPVTGKKRVDESSDCRLMSSMCVGGWMHRNASHLLYCFILLFLGRVLRSLKWPQKLSV